MMGHNIHFYEAESKLSLNHPCYHFLFEALVCRVQTLITLPLLLSDSLGQVYIYLYIYYVLEPQEFSLSKVSDKVVMVIC